MSPKPAFILFRPKMKQHTSHVWNSVRRYEDGTSWLPEARAEIAQLERLEENWDSYGSRPIQPAAVNGAIRFIFAIPAKLVPAPHISPIPGGGIGFHWRMAGRDLEIEVTPSGTIEFLKSYPGGDKEPEEGALVDVGDYSILRWVAGRT